MSHLRNVLAVIVGFAAGSLVNMGLVYLGHALIPPPPGMNAQDAQSLAANVHLLEPKHFVFPFLAHALGTFAGAFIACKMAGSVRVVCGFIVGALFLAGGIAASAMIKAPAWFMALDLLGAYLPMAWLATRLGGAGKKG